MSGYEDLPERAEFDIVGGYRRMVLSRIHDVFVSGLKADNELNKSGQGSVGQSLMGQERTRDRAVQDAMADELIPVDTFRVTKEPRHDGDAAANSYVSRLTLHIPKSEVTDEVPPTFGTVFISLEYKHRPEEREVFVLTDESFNPYSHKDDLTPYMEFGSDRLIWMVRPELIDESPSSAYTPSAEDEVISPEGDAVTLEDAQVAQFEKLIRMINTYDHRILPVDGDSSTQAA